MKKKQIVEQVDQSILKPVLQKSLHCDSIENIVWKHTQVAPTVYHLTGTGNNEEEEIPWSIFLKVLSPMIDIEPSSDLSWKHESLIYQSNLKEHLPEGLSVPRCFEVVYKSESEIWIWLEDVTEEPHLPWTLNRYQLAAQHLGRLNGEWIEKLKTTSRPWLNKSNRLRKVVKRGASGIELLRQSLNHPNVSRFYSKVMVNDIFRFWAERQTFLQVLDNLPQTFCHLDASRRNIFSRRKANENSEETVLIDWGYAGIGAVGEEIASLGNGALLWFEFEKNEAQKVNEVIFEGYLEGLSDAGWNKDGHLARYGYTSASALRYITRGPEMIVPLLLSESKDQKVQLQQTFGRSLPEILEHWLALTHYWLRLAREAQGLLKKI